MAALKAPIKPDYGNFLETWRMRLNGSTILYDGTLTRVHSVNRALTDEDTVEKRRLEILVEEADTTAGRNKAYKKFCEYSLEADKRAGIELKISYLKSFRDTFTVKGDSPLLNIRPIPPGYFVDGNKVLYFTRIPVSRASQGINNANTRVTALDETLEYTRKFNSIGQPLKNKSSDYSSNPLLAQIVDNSYVSFSEALRKVIEPGPQDAMPFNRNFAILEDCTGVLGLYYRKCKKIGISYDEGRSFTLFLKYKYHTEELRSLGVPLNN